jgi:hypothetical protein
MALKLIKEQRNFSKAKLYIYIYEKERERNEWRSPIECPYVRVSCG